MMHRELHHLMHRIASYPYWHFDDDATQAKEATARTVACRTRSAVSLGVVARVSAATRGTTREGPGYRFAHPGYALYALAGAGGDIATAASVVSRRKVNVSCK
jgi:hypothetical protein